MLAEDWGVQADLWSVTSWNELARNATAAEEWNLLHPGETPRTAYVADRLAGVAGPVVAVSDYMRAVPLQIARWVPGDYRVLGADGFGFADTRPAARRFFHIDAQSVVVQALQALADAGEIDRARWRRRSPSTASTTRPRSRTSSRRAGTPDAACPSTGSSTPRRRGSAAGLNAVVPTLVDDIAMITLDCAEVPPVADFWTAALGYEQVAADGENYAMLARCGPALGFGKVEGYQPPRWPNEHGSKQFHLDLAAEDVDAEAERLRARRHARRPATRRDLAGALDPAGTRSA